MLVLASGQRACVKIIGRANCQSTVDFKNVCDGLLQQGCTRLVLDLSECALMDSTFLGCLAGIGKRLRLGPNPPAGRPRPSIELLNPNARVAGLLENLGVLDLFLVVTGDPNALSWTNCAVVECAGVGKEATTLASLEAHQTLMELNPANVPKFKDVATFLAEDLRRHVEERNASSSTEADCPGTSSDAPAEPVAAV